MAELTRRARSRIGVKFDQPGIGFKAAGADAPTGFDIEMGKIIAAKLGIDSKNIEWTETISDNREPFLQNGTVDFVLASYSITDERRQIVGQAGPYYVTGQQLLVTKDNDSDQGARGPQGQGGLLGHRLDVDRDRREGVRRQAARLRHLLRVRRPAQERVGRRGDHRRGDPARLRRRGPGRPQVVGREFTEERYGIGYKKDDADMCEFLNETIKGAFEDGTWSDAFEATLGESGAETPEPPDVDACA